MSGGKLLAETRFLKNSDEGRSLSGARCRLLCREKFELHFLFRRGRHIFYLFNMLGMVWKAFCFIEESLGSVRIQSLRIKIKAGKINRTARQQSRFKP